MTRSLALSLAVLFCGCGTTYRVEMSVDGDNVHRSTVIASSRVGASSQPASADSGTVVDGIGATSTVAHYPTSIGQAWIYLERIRGSDSPADILKRRFDAADKLADLLLDWVTKRYSRQKECGKLKQFVDHDLRQDMKNITANEFIAEAAGRMSGRAGGQSDIVRQDMAARLTHYMLEHEYLTTDDLPAVYNTITMIDDSRTDDWLNIARRILRNKVRLTDEAFINDILAPSTPGDPKGFNQCLRTNPLFQAAAKKAVHENITSQPADYEPASYAMELASQVTGRLPGTVIPGAMFLWAIMDDRVEMSLSVRGSVAVTNGDYDAKAKTIHWNQQVSGKEASAWDFPAMQYAIWAQPDEKFQQQHFGQVILADATLVQYCLWRNGLAADEGRKWDAFIATLQPAKLAGQVAIYADTLKQAHTSTNADADVTIRHLGLKLLMDYLAKKGEDK